MLKKFTDIIDEVMSILLSMLKFTKRDMANSHSIQEEMSKATSSKQINLLLAQYETILDSPLQKEAKELQLAKIEAAIADL